VQLALLLLRDKIKLYNITSKCEEPESLVAETSRKQWLVTPNGAALLAVYPTFTKDSVKSSWVLDAFALEQCLPEQHMFDRIATEIRLPDHLAQLPSPVRIPNCYIVFICQEDCLILIECLAYPL
jgi:hypothetical protein